MIECRIAVCCLAVAILFNTWPLSFVAADEPAASPPTIGPASPGKPKPADETPAAASAVIGATTTGGDRVSKADVLGFRQSKVTAEATELEDRMFRLSEALKQMEPENASRLLLALKFAREELIRLQMQRAEQLLQGSKLSEATATQQQILAKLERLETLLLSKDLDFQMKLQRLRQLREILARLDSSIQEESRQLGMSRQMAAAQARQEGLRKRRDAGDQDAADELARLERQLDRERFEAQRRQQAANRALTGGIAESARGLGKSGLKALAELSRAGGSMSSAEDALRLLKSEPAAGDQQAALDSLNQARRDLQDEMQQLLDEISHEVRNRVIEGLRQMLEWQVAVREATAELGPRVAKESRQAIAQVVALATREAKIATEAETLIQLAEETEFGVALPSALRVVRCDMILVEQSLKQADASMAVVTLERRIEADLESLLDAMKRMPASRKPRSGNPSRNPRDRERELNRLVAELKMVRLIQLRVNGETTDVDAQRGAGDTAGLTDRLRQQIGQVESRQDAVRVTTEKLSERIEE